MVSFTALFVAAFATLAVASPCTVATNADSSSALCLEVNTKRSEAACAPSVNLAGQIECLTAAVSNERREVHDSVLGQFSPRQMKRLAKTLRSREICIAATNLESGIVGCADAIPLEKRSSDKCIAQVSINGDVTCVIPAVEKRSSDKCIAQVSINGDVTCVIPAPGN